MNETDRQLRDLLEAAVGEPPHQVSAEAVRRRVTWRRAVECITAALAVVVVAVLGPAGIRALGHTLRPAGQQGSATVYVGGHSAAIAVTPDGQTAYVVNGTSGTVVPVSTATNQAGNPIKVGGIPALFGSSPIGQIAITPDGKTAYVLTGEHSVIPISTATNAPGRPIRFGSDCRAQPFVHPVYSIAITPDGKTAYVTCEKAVIPISTATNRVGQPIPIPLRDPSAAAITP